MYCAWVILGGGGGGVKKIVVGKKTTKYFTPVFKSYMSTWKKMYMY